MGNATNQPVALAQCHLWSRLSAPSSGVSPGKHPENTRNTTKTVQKTSQIWWFLNLDPELDGESSFSHIFIYFPHQNIGYTKNHHGFIIILPMNIAFRNRNPAPHSDRPFFPSPIHGRLSEIPGGQARPWWSMTEGGSWTQNHTHMLNVWNIYIYIYQHWPKKNHPVL